MPLLQVRAHTILRPWIFADIHGIGDLKPEPMITSVIKMDEVEEKGFKALIEEKDKHVKILVEVSP